MAASDEAMLLDIELQEHEARVAGIIIAFAQLSLEPGGGGGGDDTAEL